MVYEAISIIVFLIHLGYRMLILGMIFASSLQKMV